MRCRIGALGLFKSVLDVVILDNDQLGLGDLECGALMLGTDSLCVGVLVRGSRCSVSGISDSEKLLVLDRDDANLFTEFTRSTSLPYVETTRIDGVTSWTCVFSDLRLRHLSELRAFWIAFFVRDSG